MTENLYDNPDAPEETADAAQAPVAAADANAQPIVTSNGTVIPMRTNRSSPIASLIGKKDFGIEPLSPKDYYPTIGEPVQIGQFNGKYIGSMPQYSGAGALYPYAIVDARRRALEQAAMLSKLQDEQAKNVKHEALPQRAWTKPAFQNHLNNQFQDAFQKVKSKYASEADFWKDYDAKGQAYIDVDTAAKNTHAFAQGVDVLFNLGEEMKTAEATGKFVPKDYRQELNKILREGADVADPEMQQKFTKLFSQSITENLDAPLKEASENLAKRTSDAYADLETVAKRAKLSEDDKQGRRLKIEQTIYSPEGIDAEAEKILANHKAGAINEYTTKTEREKYKDDEDKLKDIAKKALVTTIANTIPRKYKEQIEGSAPAGAGTDKNRNYTVEPVKDQKKGVGAIGTGSVDAQGNPVAPTVFKQTITAKNVWPLKEPINAQVNNAKIYDIEKGEPVNMLGDTKLSFSTVQELPYITDANGSEYVYTDEVRAKYPRLKPEYKKFASAIINEGRTTSSDGMSTTSDINQKPVYVDYESVKGIVDEKGIKLNNAGETKTTSIDAIKALVGKPGYEGYSEKELIEHYKKNGYQIK